MAIYVLSVLTLICSFGLSSGTRMPDWDKCNCHWDTWKSWNDCTETCYGYRYRERAVWHHNTPSCQDINKVCESGEFLDSGWYEWQDCNTHCASGQVAGSGRSKYCQCPTGSYGTCCDHRVTCSTPPAVTNGTYSSSGNYYGDTVTYQCLADFQLVGDATRTCQLHSLNIGVWSGTTPRCLFARTCRSNPCQNGATCEDLLEQYRCHCKPGWSGQNCERDIQPPVVKSCPKNITEFTSLKTLNVTWNKPNFSDPLGFQIRVESNYQGEWCEFPWGRFTVQYSAVKPSNGLRETCVFGIQVLPHPCAELPAPQRGVMVCNGWQKELGRFCLASCLRDFYLPLGHSPATWHVCGATGHWSRDFPADVECKDKTQTVMRTLLPQPSSCNDTAGLGELASAYVDTFKASNFSFFCSEWAAYCKPQIVDCHLQGMIHLTRRIDDWT